MRKMEKVHEDMTLMIHAVGTQVTGGGAGPAAPPGLHDMTSIQHTIGILHESANTAEQQFRVVGGQLSVLEKNLQSTVAKVTDMDMRMQPKMTAEMMRL